MAIYYHIIQIDDAVGQIQLSQHVLHKMLECCRHVAQSERHPGEIIKPKLLTVNAVYCCDSGAMRTCQNPLLKSMVEKCAALAMLSSTSCILGRG